MAGVNIDENKTSVNLLNTNLPYLLEYSFPDCSTQSGKYLKSTGTGMIWDTPAGGTGTKVETHIPLISIATAVSI